MFQSISLCCGVLRNVSCVKRFLVLLRSVFRTVSGCCRSVFFEVFFSVTYCFLVFLSVS